MPWSWELVVEIRSGDRLLGTGAMIAPGRILTARHVIVDRDDQPRESLRVHHKKGSTSAEVKWGGAPNLDVAVLSAEIEGAGLGHPLASISGSRIGAHVPWESKGYPLVSEEWPNSALKSVQGNACSLGKGGSMLELDVAARPDLMRGLSGAPVVVSGQIVGVLRAVPKHWGGGRVEATPVAAFINIPEFRKALGLTAEDERLMAELEALRGRLEERLHASLAFTDALAKQLDVADRGEGLVARVASTILGATGEAIATALDELVHIHVEPVRALMAEVLPLAGDWHAAVLRTREALAGGGNAVELPLRTETVAEIVLAGADGRCCHFAPDAVVPDGHGHVRLPAAAHAPLFQSNETRLVEAVVMNLGAEGRPEKRFWSDLRSKFRRYDELRTVVEMTLRRRARPGSRDYLPHYMLFIDAELDDGGKADMGALWAVARAAFGRELPSLRLVRLTGGARELGEEYPIADRVRRVRDHS